MIFHFTMNRLWQSAILIFLVSLITFFLINLSPGGPSSVMRIDTTDVEREALMEQMGLDQPVMVRYGQWLVGAFKGDFGTSLTSNEPVMKRILERFPFTIKLTILTMIVSIVIGILFGVMSVIYRGKWIDHIVNFLSVIGLSVPAFWFAIMLILVFSIHLQFLPSSGVGSGSHFNLFGDLKYFIMPVIILSTATLPNIVRFTRSSMLDVITQNYIRTARAKGASEFMVIYWHALRNALIPVVSIIGVLIPRLLSGAVITEAVFGLPGLGRLIIEAAQGRDYPLVMGVTIVVTIIVVVSNFIVDIIYSRIDPRVSNI